MRKLVLAAAMAMGLLLLASQAAEAVSPPCACKAATVSSPAKRCTQVADGSGTPGDSKGCVDGEAVGAGGDPTIPAGCIWLGTGGICSGGSACGASACTNAAVAACGPNTTSVGCP